MIFIVMMVILISRAMITWSSMRMFLKRGKLLHHLTNLYNLDKYKKNYGQIYIKLGQI